MADVPPDFLVCGMIPASNAAPARCSKCQAVIWPTVGSLICANAEHIPMICLDCYAKIENSIFAGFMDQGVTLPEPLSVQLFEEILPILVKRNGI
jgi:hypothetical protein